MSDDVSIKSIDPNRPPQIRKEPYIELFFELSAVVSREWCDEFNSMLQKHMSKPKIRSDEGQFIETWVRRAEDIPAHLELLKKAVKRCDEVMRVRLMEAANVSVSDSGERTESSAQAQLNSIIRGLNFSVAS